MAKQLNQLNVNLAFTADTNKAKAAITDLQASLNKISTLNVGDNLKLKEASEAAKQLSYHLNQAYNATTGNIDLSKLNNSLKKSSTNITILSNKLLEAGSIGQQSFINLAKAISSADYPMVKLNSRLAEMWTTLKNTARWQLSSSVLHGFMGAIQSAHGYAQDLNESLNNIRIVTGQNTEEMARFAQEANRAAKNLSTNTADYTNASLIYYQQGLSDKEVQERTDITIKMANAARVSAETASDQLTAVWNNFYDGTQSLEYYVDIMTALGAATASSTDEISTGLNKFAAAANTVGLSYEYATTALATVTATTRESADIVGTAFKTLFARIQGLTLGETLEDGTDLNKYSEALNKVGIDIKNANGEMKNMDTILNELGTKWQTLGKDQQIALAQTVAGVRQYTQLVALMDNWDYFQENLGVVSNASGALQEQADIYAESWEAASKRAKAAAEGVYDSLINENLFIDFNNVLADLLTGVENVIDGLGGLKGVASAAGSFLLSLFSHKIQPAIQQLVQNIKVLFQSAQTQASTLVKEMQTKTSIEIDSGKYDTAQIQQLRNTALLSEARARLTVASKNLTEQEQLLYQFDIQTMELAAQKAETIAANIANLEKEAGMLIVSADATETNNNANRIYNQLLKEQIALSAEAFDRASSSEGTSADYKEYFAAEEAIDLLETKKIELNEAINQSVSALLQEYEQMQRNNIATDEFTISTEEAMKGFQEMILSLESIPKKSSLDSYKSALEMIYKSLPSIARKSTDVQKALKKAFNASRVTGFKNGLKDMSNAIGKITIDGKSLSKIIQELNPKAYQELEKILKKIKKEEQSLIPIQEQLTNALNNFNPTHMISGIERLSAAAGALGQVAMMGQSISSMIDAWNNADLSFGEKLSTTFMSLSMLIPGVISSMKGLSTVLQGTTLHSWAYVASIKAQTHSEIAAEGAKQLLLIAGGKEFTQTGALMAAQYLLGNSYKKSSFEKRRAAEASFIAALAEKGLTKAGFEAALSQMAVSLGLDETEIAALRAKLSVDALKTSLSTLLLPIGLVIAAITTLVAAISIYNKQQKEEAKRNQAADQEKIDNVLKEAEAYETARKEYSKLLDVYEEAIATSDGTATAQQAIANATWDLCDALGVEVNLLDRLQGKSEEYIFEARAKAADEALEQLKDYQKDAETLSQGILNAYQEMDNVSWWKNLTYDSENLGFGRGAIGTTEDGNMFYSADWGMAVSDEKAITRAISDFIYSDDFKYAGKVDTYTGRELEFTKGITPEEQYEIITYIMDYVSKNTDRANQNSSEVYTWFRDIIKAGKEPYNQLDELNVDDNISEYAVAAAEAEEQQLISSISTYEDYIKMQNTLATKIQDGYLAAGLSIDAKAARQLAIELMSTKENIQNLVGLEEVSKKTGINLNKIKTLYEKYGSELFWQINFDEIKSEKDLETLLEKLQNAADAEAIKIKLNIIEVAKDKLKPGMGIDDYATFENESGIKWGTYDEHYKQNIIDYNEFLQMSYNQQMDYLNKIQSGYENAQLENLNNSVQNWKTVSQDYQVQYDKIQNKTESTKWSNEDSERARMLEQKIAHYQDLYNYSKGVGDTERMEDDMNIIRQAESELKQLIQKYGGDTNYITAEDLQELNRLEALIETETANAEQYEAQIQSIVNGRLGAIETLTELENELQTLSQMGIETFNYDTYAEALIRIGQEYENCTEEIKDYEQALQFGTIAEINSTEQALKLAISIGEAAEKYGLNTEEIKIQAAQLTTAYGLSGAAAAKLAIENHRMNEGVSELSENWSEWKEELSKSDKTTADYAKTVVGLTQTIAKLVGASEDLELSQEFLNSPKTLELIEKAAEGDINAINELGVAIAAETVKLIKLNAAVTRTLEDGTIKPISLEDFKTAKDTVIQGIQDLQTQITNGSIAVGDSIGSMGTTWAESLNEMAMATGMSVEEMNSLLSSMGVDAEVVTEYVPQRVKVPVYQTEEKVIQNDPKITETKTVQTGVAEMDGVIPVAQINMGEDKKSPNITYIGNGNVSSSSIGGGKTSKAPEKIKKSDMIDRYKQLNDSLETVSDAMSDAEKAADRLYGRSRLKQMEKVNDELLKEIELQKQKRKEAEEYLKNVDKPALEETFKALSSEFGLGEEIQLQFNTDGSVKNIEAIMDMVIAAYNAKAEELKDSMNEADQALLENMKATIEAFKDAIGQYDDTRSIIREAENARQDAFNKWQDNNYEQLSYSLEINVEINEAKLQDLEYRINRLGDTAAEMAEAIGLIYSNLGTGNQYSTYLNSLREYSDYKTTLDSSFAAGRISQADYVEGLREVSDGIYENLEALNDLDKTMMEYYGNTLTAANEELDKFIERMSHSAGILEHYSSIMDLLGKSSDYKTMGVILEGQADIAENQAKSSKAIMEMMQGEAEDRYRAYQEALASGDKAAAELYLKQYEEALAAAQEAEDEYLSNAEQWAESLKAILENKLADLGKTLEEALTGGTSFEQLTTQMERAASLQEEYLTSTNQIYETTKMMRAAQQEIDKTTNTVAKNKIANFIAETKQLQNQSKLSQYELDVQQAKYDLLLAEIALQEAQNAKSTVRLQRDAEGNFGYVYTADSSAIADATQKYEDAQNALYNIGLEGANDYGQKYQQTMNEMYDSLTELQNQYLSGAFESESAYNLAVEEAKRYYYTKLEQYSSLYATATTTDSRVVAEAWFNDFSEMMTTSETWKLAIEEHVANVSSAFGEWQSQVEAIASDAGIGGDLESLKSKVNEIVTETNSLTTELTKQGGTIDSLQDSLDTVKQSTDAYAELREQLQLVAERYREVAQAASEAAAAEALIDRSNEQIKDFGEQANECIRKIESTYAEMEEKLKEVKEKYLRGEIDEDQYNKQINAIKSQYYEELKKLSQEYREILAKDNDLVAEDWFLTLEEMLKTEETFNQSVEEYLKEVEEYFKNMGQTTQDVAVETGGILQKFTADVGGVKKAIDLLNQSIVGTGGLVDAFEEQDSYIDNSIINSYESLCSSLSDTINMYRELAAAARSATRAQSSVSGGGGGGSSYSGIDMNTHRSEFSYAHFDTGGYTGQWGSYGKLAMLHEKELILNKGDTENFLASMGILNNILQTIDLQSANAQIGGILTTPNFHGGGNDMLEQNVHIEASFPNVQNSNDIEEAFNNLINRASQYANRK